MNSTALIIGNTDGIGLGLTNALLERDWPVIGISRSPSNIDHPGYEHHIADVRNGDFETCLKALLSKDPEIGLAVYCAGIGELFNPDDMSAESDIFEVNLMGLVKTVSLILPAMIARGSGHLIGLSSVADAMLSPEAPSYHASKAAFSNYLEGLALAVKPKAVHISNVRFGFVDTKMAKGDRKPFMMSIDRAVFHVLRCIDKKPIRYTAPRIVLPLIALRRWALRIQTW